MTQFPPVAPQSGQPQQHVPNFAQQAVPVTSAAVPPQPAQVPQAPQQPQTPNVGSSGTPTTQPFRILGLQPVLFIGIVLMILVTLLTIVLVLTGDIAEQGPRVVWTVVAFLTFTGLLAIDMLFGRVSQTPVVIGVVANIYMLLVLMIATWVQPEYVDPWDRDLRVFALFGIYFGTVLIVRAVGAISWGVIALGKRIDMPVAKVTGYVGAGVWALAGILMTVPFILQAFGLEPGDIYVQMLVISLILAALVSCILVLLYWNRRNIDYEERKAAGLLDQPKQPVQQNPVQGWPQHQVQLLPWPTLPDGTPYPAGPDGQPRNPF